MKKLLLALALAVASTSAWAQNPTCPTRAPGDSTNACASTAFVTQAIAAAVPVLDQNEIFVGNASNQAISVPMSGDCTIVAAGAITCTRTNGTLFGAFATGTDAANLTGTVSVNRFNNGSGASSSTFLRGDGTWVAPSGGGITATRVAVTTTATVQNADKNKTIALGGSAFYTVTLNAASGYDPDYQVRMVNEDTRGKTLAINGLTSFILWPGQTIEIFNQNNVWKIGAQYNPRSRLAAALTLYVNSSTGNNNNDCLATGDPCQTIQGAVNKAYANFDHNSFTPTIQLASGVTQTECVQITQNLIGASVLAIRGDTSNPQNYTVNCTGGGDAFYVKNRGIADIRGITITTAGYAITVEQGGIADFGNVRFGTASAGHVRALDSGFANCVAAYEITGNGLFHFIAQKGRIKCSFQVTIATARAFTTYAYSLEQGLIDAVGYTSTGAGVAGTTGKRCDIIRQSAISTNGGSLATFFPGNTNGTADAATFSLFY